MKWSYVLSSAVALTCATSAANAVSVLDFEGMGSGPDFIRDFYNGGNSASGASGTNFGVAFSDNAVALCLDSSEIACSDASLESNPDAPNGALVFISGADSLLNVTSGFDTGISFYYAAPTQTGNVSVFDGLYGSGNLLATLTLPTTPSTCDDSSVVTSCPFVAVGASFDGIAMSVTFSGVENEILFDDLTFGSATPGLVPSVPEPETYALMLAGMGVLAFVARRRRSRAQSCATPPSRTENPPTLP